MQFQESPAPQGSDLFSFDSLPDDPPLSARTWPLVAWTGAEVLVPESIR